MQTNQNHPIIPKTWNLPEIFRRRLGESVGRQRLMVEEGNYLAVLHQLPMASDKGQRQAALFWINERQEWKSAPDSGGRSALRELVKTYQDRIQSLDQLLDRSEKASEIHDIIDEVTPLLRAGRNMMQVIQELRQSLSDDQQLIVIRDQAIDVERSSELLLQDAKSSLDYLIARNSSEQAEAAAAATYEARKLNRLAAFFFPLATLATVFGMNPPSEVVQLNGVWIVVAVGLITGLIVYGLLCAGRKS